MIVKIFDTASFILQSSVKNIADSVRIAEPYKLKIVILNIE